MASRFNQISTAIAHAPDTDRRKIQSTRDLLSRGMYRIDPHRIADKLMRLETALLGGR